MGRCGVLWGPRGHSGAHYGTLQVPIGHYGAGYGAVGPRGALWGRLWGRAPPAQPSSFSWSSSSNSFRSSCFSTGGRLTASPPRSGPRGRGNLGGAGGVNNGEGASGGGPDPPEPPPRGAHLWASGAG